MTSFSKIGIHRQFRPQIMTTIELRGTICAFIYSANVSSNEEACIVSTTPFFRVCYVKQCYFYKMEWEQMLFSLVN